MQLARAPQPIPLARVRPEWPGAAAQRDAAKEAAVARQFEALIIFFDRADQAAAGFRDTGADLAGLQRDIASAADTATTEVNAITASLGRVNAELRRTATGSGAANGLLDNRDSLLADLASRVRISVSEGPRGSVEVRLGTGAAAAVLVPLKGNVTRIGVRDGPSGYEVLLDPTHAATVVRLPASGSSPGCSKPGGRRRQRRRPSMLWRASSARASTPGMRWAPMHSAIPAGRCSPPRRW